MISKTNRAETRELDQALGMRIKLARTRRGVSQERMAYLLGVSFQQVQKYESGVNRIYAMRLVEIAQYLAMPITDLLPPAPGTGIPAPSVISHSAIRLIGVHERLNPEQQRSLLAIARVLADNNVNNSAKYIRTPDMSNVASALTDKSGAFKEAL